MKYYCKTPLNNEYIFLKKKDKNVKQELLGWVLVGGGGRIERVKVGEYHQYTLYT
jgi:hypothetical protein